MSDPTTEASPEPTWPDDLVFLTRSGAVVCRDEGFTEDWFAPADADPEGAAPPAYWHIAPELLTLLKPASRYPVEALLFGDRNELRVRLTFEPAMCPSAPFTVAETGKPIRRFRTLPDAIRVAERVVQAPFSVTLVGRFLPVWGGNPKKPASEASPTGPIGSPIPFDQTRKQ